MGPARAGLLTGCVRKGQHNELRRAAFVTHVHDERRLDTVERYLSLAAEVGLPLTHLAMALAITHPGVTSALLGPRTMNHLDGLFTGLDVALTDDVLDRIDEIVPPGTEHRHARPGLRPAATPTGEPAPPAHRRTRRHLTSPPPIMNLTTLYDHRGCWASFRTSCVASSSSWAVSGGFPNRPSVSSISTRRSIANNVVA